MRRNIVFPGRTDLMRKDDFMSWNDELETSEQLSEFQIRPPVREQAAQEVITHVRPFDHSGLRVECDDTVIRIHGCAGSFRALGFALQTAEELQARHQHLVHVDVRIGAPCLCRRTETQVSGQRVLATNVSVPGPLDSRGLGVKAPARRSHKADVPGVPQRENQSC